MEVHPPVNGTQAFVPQLGHNILERAQPQTQRPLEELLTALRKVHPALTTCKVLLKL